MQRGEKWVINSRSHLWQSIFNQDEGKEQHRERSVSILLCSLQFVAVRLHFETRTSYLNSVRQMAQTDRQTPRY